MTATGKLNSYSPPILLSNQWEPILSPMETQIAPDAALRNADKNAARACLTARLTETMFADILAMKTEVGKQVSILASIETSALSRQ